MDDDKSDVTPCDDDDNDDMQSVSDEGDDDTVIHYPSVDKSQVTSSTTTKPGNILRVKSDVDIRENNNEKEEVCDDNLVNKNQLLSSLPKQSWLLRWWGFRIQKLKIIHILLPPHPFYPTSGCFSRHCSTAQCPWPTSSTPRSLGCWSI